MSDLPNLAATTLLSHASVDLVEATGYAPGKQTIVSSLRLGADDTPSVVPGALKRNSDGSTAFSMERWFRLQWEQPLVRASAIRFWIPDYAPDTGWSLAWGLSDAYQKPTWAQSQYAVNTIPTTDPGRSAAVLAEAAQIEGAGGMASDWFVLQARWDSAGLGPMQVVMPHLHFAWVEL